MMAPALALNPFVLSLLTVGAVCTCPPPLPPAECTPETGDEGKDTSTLLTLARACPIPIILRCPLESRPS